LTLAFLIGEARQRLGAALHIAAGSTGKASPNAVIGVAPPPFTRA
jgi:hypothetical protein